MHRLLKRQLKKADLFDKIDITDGSQISRLLQIIDKCYYDFDDDRYLIERSMEISSEEMHLLYQQLEQTSEEKILQSERKFQRLVKNLREHYFFYSHDIDGVLTYISESIQAILGYNTDEFLTNYDKYLTDNPNNQKVIYHTQESIKGKQQPPYHVEIYHKDGSIRTLEVTEIPIRNSNSDVIGVDGIARDISSTIKLEQKLDHQAKHDSLTGLPNRHLFLDRLGQAINRAERQNKQIAVFFLDLDHFKEVNDSLGHKTGDKLLVQFTQLLTQNIRRSDTIARLGGDEFTLIIEGFESTDTVIDIVQKLIQRMNQSQTIGEHQLYVTFSLGISIYPDDTQDPEELLKNADAAMYKAKKEGRNNYQFYTADMTEHALERIMLETQLRKALEENQLDVYYQFQINAANDLLIGMETLTRWNHPELGMIPPSKFILLAEDTGLIIQLDDWVMDTVFSQWIQWEKSGFSIGKLSLNLSRLRIGDKNLINVIKNKIDKYGIKPQSLIFEVTESQIMKKTSEAIRTLNMLHDLGVEIAIDDFGTGYSSLSYLKKLPIDKLKIDQSFIRDISIDQDDMEITRTIIAMAKNLNLDVIAEGVETVEQKNFLVKNNCYKIQGYFYHKPSPANEVEQLLLNMKKTSSNLNNSK